MRRAILPAALAAAILGGTALASAPAAAQDGWQASDRVRSDDRRPDDRGWSDMDGYGREQFERGYRAGREDERRRLAERRGAGGASGQDRDRYVVIPNYYPDRVPFQRAVVMPDYSRSMDWLLAAAQSLREAIQAMAQQPAGERRNDAMQRAREALLETQQAMIQLPPELRTR